MFECLRDSAIFVVLMYLCFVVPSCALSSGSHAVHRPFTISFTIQFCGMISFFGFRSRPAVRVSVPFFSSAFSLVFAALSLSLSLSLLLQPATTRAQPLPPRADNLTVNVVRNFAGELFSLNSRPYMEPLVNLLNATTNGRLFQTALVGDPSRKNTFYVRVGVHGMVAFVRPDQQTYAPVLPSDELSITKLLPFISGNILAGQINIRDTVGLVGYVTNALIGEGLRDGSITVPKQAPTFFGNIRESFTVPKTYFRTRLQQGLAGIRLPASAEAGVLNAINQLPDAFPLPAGQSLSLLPLAVPQIEIGSLYGTELLIRFIPALDWGNNIGRFGFWGVGVKHSVSQYLTDLPLEIAVQGVVQGTSLSNRIGVTGAELTASANIVSVNVHASKRWGNFEAFSGLSFDRLAVNASYTFKLPQQLQVQLGLLRPVDGNMNGTIEDNEYIVDVANGYPGDTQPQTKEVPITATGLRWTVGAAYHIGKFSIVADYNLSTFSMLTLGLTAQF
jgi:hypothetical protein